MKHKSGTKWNKESAIQAFKEKGFTMVNPDEFVNVSIKVNFKDNEGYLYFNSLHKVNLNKQEMKFSVSNPHTIFNIKLWCKINNKLFVLLDNQEYKGNDKKLQWQCLKNSCGDIFEMNWNDILQGGGCAVCHGKQVGLSNCLAINNIELAKQWHPFLNGNLTPWDVTCFSKKDIWWICEQGHKWHDSVAHRNDKTVNRNCPYCSNHRVSEENNLLVNFPDLCKEWDYGKNFKSPLEYTYGSNDKVFWKCKECGHEWGAIIYSRTCNNTGCPNCSKSKGETKISEFILKNNIKFKQHVKFNNLLGVGGRQLSYDFYLPNYNLLIEYQGQYHDGTANNQTEEEFIVQQEHDRRKKEYVQNENINFLEIWYWDFDNIETILQNELQKLKEELMIWLMV